MIWRVGERERGEERRGGEGQVPSDIQKNFCVLSLIKYIYTGVDNTGVKIKEYRYAYMHSYINNLNICIAGYINY